MSSAVEILIKTAYQGQGASAAKVDLSSIKTLGKSVSDSLKNVGSTLTGIGGKLTASVTLPIVGIGGASLKLASDFEQTQVAFTTMLGDADKAKTLFNELRDFSASTPFEFPEIRDAGRSLLAFGVSADDVTESLRRIGDISAGVGAPVGEIAELYGKAKVQGRLFAEDINQFQGRGIPILQNLAAVLGVSTSEVKNLVEKGKVGFPELEAAFQRMTNEGGQFAGMMEAQSQTLGGLFSTLKDNVTLLLADLGTQIVDTFDLKTKLTGAIEFLGGLSEKIRNFAQSNPEMFKLAVSLAAVAAAIGPVLVGVGWLVSAIGAAMPVIAGIGAALGALLSPVGLVVAGVGLLAAAIYNDWGGIGTFASELWQRVTTALSYIPDAIQELISHFITFDDSVHDTTEGIEGFLTSLGLSSTNAAAVGQTLTDLSVGLYSLGQYFVAVVEDGDYMNDWLTHLPESIRPAVEGLGQLTAAVLDLAGGQDFATLQTSVTTAFSSIGTAIQSYFSGDISLGGLASVVSEGFSTITSAVSAFFGGQDFGTFLEKIQWSDFIESLTWENFLSKMSDWGTYITSLNWGAFMAIMLDWGNYITSLDWTGFVVQLLDWATWIPALAWNTVVAAIDWVAYLTTLDWSGYVSEVDWSQFIAAAFEWSSYIASVAWSDWIPAAFSWSSYVFSLTWSSFVSKLNWPSISWPGFSTFVPHLSWPSISWPGWGSFIPAFPGWPNISGMISDAIGSATSYVTGNNAVGTSYWGGGLTWVGERGPELVNLPSGARVHNAVDSRRMADGGAVGGASITNHIYVQNDIDVEALLFKLEDMQRRRR